MYIFQYIFTKKNSQLNYLLTCSSLGKPTWNRNWISEKTTKYRRGRQRGKPLRYVPQPRQLEVSALRLRFEASLRVTTPQVWDGSRVTLGFDIRISTVFRVDIHTVVFLLAA